jgi:hypothetical protein
MTRQKLPPIDPGEILLEEFLKPLGIKQPIPAAEAVPTSSAALEHGNLMAQCERSQSERRSAPGLASSHWECLV